jgi:hypothetical protein
VRQSLLVRGPLGHLTEGKLKDPDDANEIRT